MSIDVASNREEIRKALKLKYPLLTYEEAVDTRKAELSLHEFIKQAWHIIHPEEPFTDGKHIKMVADHLQAVSEGKIKYLLIALPPRHSKSTLVSVFWNAWEWTRNPSKSYMCITHTLRLTLRDATLCRLVIKSDWYQKRWGTIWQMRKNQDAEGRYANNRGGFRFSTTRQGATGEGADRIIIDDIISAEKVEKSRVELEAANRWYATSIALRKNNPDVAVVVMMQRLHENDLVGYLLRTEPKKWVKLFLPMLYDPKTRCVTPMGEDWREKEREPLWPERYNGYEGGFETVVEEFLTQLGEYGFSCQCQQHPVPPSGGIFKLEWWRPAFAIPKGEYGLFFTSWDLATKKGQENDYTVGVVFYYIPRLTHYYVIDVIRKRMEFVEQEETIIATALKYPRCIAHVVEEYNSGNGILARLQKAKEEGTITGEMVGTRFGTDKPSKYRSVAPVVKSGRVFLFSHAPWASIFLSELGVVPLSNKDDQADAFTQGVIYMETRDPDPTVQVFNPNLASNLNSNNPRDRGTPAGGSYTTTKQGIVLPTYF